MLYLDTSALVKLVLVETHSADLAAWLNDRVQMRWVTSVLADVELPRAVIRAGSPEGLASVPAVLARLDRFEIDEVVRTTAASLRDPDLRTLDAIHLATATVAASTANLDAVVTYDRRLASVVSSLGMRPVAPGVT